MQAIAKIIVVLLLILVSPAAYANTVVNGSFEAGFGGWTTTGITSIQTSAFGVTPTGGTNQALLTTVGGGLPTTAALEAFVGISAGSLAAISTGTPTQGSAIKQTITASAGDVLTLNYDFLTSETGGSGVNDFAFISIVSGINQVLASAQTGGLVSGVSGYAFQTGYKTFTYTFTTTGSFTIGLGVLDVGDTIVDSALLLDQVRTDPTAVPLPRASYAGMGMLGLVGIAEILRRRRELCL